jgi:hypothetical protein
MDKNFQKQAACYVSLTCRYICPPIRTFYHFVLGTFTSCLFGHIGPLEHSFLFFWDPASPSAIP